MAAIPAPVNFPEHEVFRINMMSNWNVLEAAEIHDIPKVVMASSVNAIGAVFSPNPVPDPEYLPVDEELPTRASDGYAQSKWLGEGMADAFCRRRQMQIASMRFHWLADTENRLKAQTTQNRSHRTGIPRLLGLDGSGPRSRGLPPVDRERLARPRTLLHQC